MPGARSPVLDSSAVQSFALERGLAVHRLLQVLPAIPAGERAAAASRYLARMGKAWPDREAERLWESVDTVLHDPGFAAIFDGGSRAEVEIMGRVALGSGERAVSGRIDRLVVTDDEVLIVDYKTNRPPPAELRDVPEVHVAQMALYRALLAPLYRDREIRSALVYTEAPVLIAVSAQTMDDALARLTHA